MTKVSPHWYAVIIAGGSGTRLYPKSREEKPKQFQKILGDKTLLQQTFERLAGVLPKNQIFIATSEKYVKFIREQLPQVNLNQIIIEPVKRNTAPAAALANAYISHHDPRAIIASLHSDHFILKPEIFHRVFKTAFITLEKHQDHIVTIGIHPTRPHTGYGYIERDKLVADDGNFNVYKVKRFVEKPDKNTAQKYVDSGRFFWNAGYFVWSSKHFNNELKKYLPAVSRGVKKIVSSLDGDQFSTILKQEFEKFPNEAIDTAIMEKTKDLLVIPADLGWSDIGSWDAIIDLIDENKKTKEGNYCEALHIGIDTHNTVILCDNPKRLIATIGIKNATIVATEDAILVTTKGRSEEVKKIIENLKRQKLTHLL